MRKLAVILLFLLLPALASAEMRLELAADQVSVGGLLEARVAGLEEAEYRYTLFSEGKQLFQGEFVPQASGFYRPREAGDYLLQVTARTADGREETAERAFQVTSIPSCQITCDQETVRTGEALTFSVDVSGGVGDCVYTYSIFLGMERILRQESRDAQWAYTPGQAGPLRIEVEVTDAQGNAAFASCQAEALPGKGISLSGGQGLFYTQGGIQTWIIHAPGIWTAQVEGDFIHLAQTCGADGDPLTVLVEESQGQSRRGSLIVTAGETTVSFPITQSRENGVEEELRLSESGDFLFVDGGKQATWLEAAGEREFAVSASGDWTAQSDADFVALECLEETLRLRADENESDTARACLVTLQCGASQAYIHVFQAPAKRGAAVYSVSLSATEGVAYQDVVIAQVTTSAEAKALTVDADAWGAPMVFTPDAAQETENGLTWRVELPLQGSGEQCLLFSAENTYGAGAKQTARLSVTGEASGFAASSANLVSDKRAASLSLRVTAATTELELLDGQGQSMGRYTAAQAEIDRCIPDDPTGRYADWTLTLDAAAQPAFVKLGDATLPVIRQAAPKQALILYSQSDGWWKDKAYRHSTLEHSGCAIFALSHGLQLLGYTGEEILPENLAKAYAFCLLEGGTMNSTLVGHAGDDFGFKTRYDLYTNLNEILQKMNDGAVFSFAVVSGHIALAAGLSQDGSKIRIWDSAPSATMERIKGGQLYYQEEDGRFIPVASLDDIPGSRYYFETGAYGGLEYYLDASYVAKRGVRLIQRR